MLTAVFAVTTVICALKWFDRYISCLTLAYYYTAKKGNIPPKHEELEECKKSVIEQLIKDLFQL